MKKILMVVVAMVMAVSANAQNPDKGLSWAIELGAGTELGIGGRAQYNFNQYVAIELPVKYAFDYRDANPNNEITAQVGVRAFSPKFHKDMKAFAAFDMGYGVAFEDGWHWNAAAVDFTLGCYLVKGWYVGYGFGGMFHNGHIPHDHVVRVGYNF